MVTERYSLNVTPGGVPLVLNISQYDVGLRQFIFTPYTNEGILPKQDMVTVTLEATKRDGNGIIHPCTYNDDGTITYVLQDQLAPVKGKVFSKIRLRGVDSETLGMAAIIWVIDQAAVDDDTQFSDSDVAAIEEWLRLGAEYVVRTEAAAEAAAESEANAKDSEDAAKASETAAKASEIAAASSETNAHASEVAAAASETNADISERNAYNSAANAHVSEVNAQESETAAKDSETAAKFSENAAKAAETTAVAKATEAINTIDNFNTDLHNIVNEAVEGLYIHSDSVVIDSSLSIEGAAAEASATGKLIAGAVNMIPTEHVTSLGPVITYEGTVDDVPVKSYAYDFEPHQAGSGDPSPSNVREISGYTSVDVVSGGFNQWDEEWKVIGNHIGSKNPIPCMPNTAYYMTAPSQPANGLKYYTAAMVQTGATRYNSGEFTTPSDAAFMMFEMGSAYGLTYNHDICINLSDPAKNGTYEPYNGLSETIPFPTEAGTVYGGTLTKNADGSGTLTVDKAVLTTDGTEPTWYKAQSLNGYYYNTDVRKHALNTIFACSHAKMTASAAQYRDTEWTALTGEANYGIPAYIHPSDDINTLDLFKAFLANQYANGTPVQWYYELKDPQTYTIPATDMAKIPTLLGDNTVWMSANGEFTSFEYRVGRIIDTTLTVEGASADAKATGDAIEAVKEIISDEDTMTVTSNYAVGSLVRVGNALYETITAVVTGETLTPGTNCILTTIKDQLLKRYTKSATDSLLSEKADKGGNHPDLTAGNANQLVSDSYVSDNAPYMMRPSAGGAEIGNREIDQLVGGTIAWNQLAGNGATPGTTERNGVTFTVNADGSVDVSGTASAGTNFNIGSMVSGHANHKQLIVGCPAGGSAFTYCLRNGYGTARDTGSGTIDAVANDSCVAQIHIEGGYAISGTLKFKPLIFDLTQMFGTTIADYIYALETAHAGDGVAWFRRLFGADYYPYDAGTLKSVDGVSAHVTRGFNQWDEEWENGTFNTTTGINYNTGSTLNQIRSKNNVTVIPNTEYYFKTLKSGTTSGAWVMFFDSNGDIITDGLPASESQSGYCRRFRNVAFTTPVDCHAIKFYMESSYGATYGDDICLNISNASRNGEYEPYVSHTYPLDSSLTLRGIPKLDSANRLYYDGDTYASDGTVTRRYKQSTFTACNTVSYHTNSGLYYCTFQLSPDGINGFRSFVIDADGVVPTVASPVVGTAYITNAGAVLVVVFPDQTITTKADADAYLAQHPVSIVYELATPTTETADPYTNPQIVDNLGTEEYVTTGILPVGHETKYLADLKSKLEVAPDSPDTDGDYIMRRTSGENVYAPLASAPAITGLGGRVTAVEGDVSTLDTDASDLKSALSDLGLSVVNGLLNITYEEVA